MGKHKKGFNWKSRQVVETTIDDSKSKKLVVDIQGLRSDTYDDCNALVIPSEKRKTKKKVQNDVPQKILSKKQRKRLQQIVDRKKKKETRASLLNALAEVQAPPEVLKKLVSITKYQTKGLKRIHEEEICTAEENTSGENGITNKLVGHRKRRMLLNEDTNEQAAKDPNIVGFESSSSSDDETSEEEEEEKDGNEENHLVCEDHNMRNTEMGTGKSKENALEEKCGCESEISHTVEREVIAVDKNSEQLPQVAIGGPKITAPNVPAVFVPVNRPPGVQEARMKLPVLAEEQAIMEAINENDVVVLAGETGSGKTTQLPQFLYEAGYARDGKMIGITEPRRVAAISMSRRVGFEMGLSSENVSYLIRYEGNVTEKTQIKFMTDGVLLKEIQSDFILSRYAVIILDEAHERSVYTDILLGLLSRIVPLRRRRGNRLKLIVMSATLRLEDFVQNEKLFRIPPPVINVESRQFPVTVHFNKYTREDYLKEAYLKACKIHTRLPPGGILIFVTGQQEVRALVRNLRKAFPYRRMEIGSEKEESNSVKLEESESEDDFPHKKNPKVKRSDEIHLPIIDLDEYPVVSSGDVDEDELVLSDDNRDMEEEIDDPKATRAPMWVLPLYSLLPGHKQAKVFEPPPPGSRLCVVATNVAETSLTIPSVRYVVDCGKEKRRRYDKTTGVSAFMVTWTSKASANQRAGRAGRTGPGHCYRLYSSAMFNDQFEEYSIPEMQRKPVDDLVLQMKAMGIHRVINFPFPSPPGQEQLQASERRLILLGALQRREGSSEDDWAARITSLGQSMATFPVAPRFAKMLALSHQQDLLAYTICMVAALAVPEVLIDTAGNKETAAFRRMWAGTGNSLLLGDPMVLMRAVGAAEHAGTTGGLASFCEKHALRLKAVVEVRKLRLQLTAEINSAIPDLDLVVDPQMPPPSDEQARLLRQLLLAGLGDQVARRVDPETIKDEEDKMKWKHAYRCGELEEPVRIHSTSVLRREYPEWVIYQEVYEVEGQRLFMRGVTAIEPEWLPSLAPALCHLSLPLPEYTPTYDSSTDSIQCHITGTYGRAAWNLPIVQIEYPSGLERYKWFAVFFLNGSVCPKLASYTSELLSTPASITKVWANLQPRTEIFLKTLMAYQVDTKAKLLEQWKQDATYLLEPYKKWLPESAHNDVINIWPPL
ncbi:hypothetical protein R5R35_004698 [Gryllus longicercus]|uniref:RNA helicase n=1 Tax=Gryllus longicercus TaxID=2509291 RepID=A0AAN9VA85_9ORTH